MTEVSILPAGTAVDALHPLILDPVLKMALQEDLGWGDLTTSLTIEPGLLCSANLVFREAGLCAGLPVVARIFKLLDTAITVNPLVKEGSWLEPEETCASITGPAQSLLTGERIALNFLQRISAVATMTRRFAEKLAGTRAKLLDTRKTTPGLRTLERYAVRIGGGYNHRFCLGDAILIKDNHIALAGSLTEAIRRVRQALPPWFKVEVETDTLFQVQEALASGVDMIMLDNMSTGDLEQAVALVAGRVPVEASGGITLERIASVARTGVDYISTGAITRLAGSLDIALDICL